MEHHALVNGNKRLGWLATAVFLELNRVGVTHVANDDVYDLVLGAAAGNDDIEKLAARLQSTVTPSRSG